MSNYKLVYFDGRGLAEPSRILLAYSGIPFEDQRLKAVVDANGKHDRSEFLALKPTLPFGQVPVLHADGEVIPQSRVIERFLARKAGLLGSNDLETTRLEAISECVRDIRDGFMKVKEIEDKKAEYISTELPQAIGFLTKYVSKTGSPGFSIGNRLSYPDFQIYYLIWVLNDMKVTTMETFGETLHAIYNSVAENANVKKYVENRATSPW